MITSKNTLLDPIINDDHNMLAPVWDPFNFWHFVTTEKVQFQTFQQLRNICFVVLFFVARVKIQLDDEYERTTYRPRSAAVKRIYKLIILEAFVWRAFYNCFPIFFFEKIVLTISTHFQEFLSIRCDDDYT